MKSVSVLVPIYKVEQYLERCIKSILEQDFNDYEIILVNDGSPDRCGEICNYYKNKYPETIKVLHKENGGLLSARQYGIRNAVGKYYIFVDSDDVLMPHAIKVLYDNITSGDYDVVRGMANRFISKNNIFPLEKYKFEEGEIISNKDYISKMYSGELPPYLWGAIYKADLFYDSLYEKLIKNKINLGEDWITNMIIGKRINKALYINNYVYSYFLNSQSIMSSFVISKEYNLKVDNILNNEGLFNNPIMCQLRIEKRIKEIINSFFIPELGFNIDEYNELISLIQEHNNINELNNIPSKFKLFIKYKVLYKFYSRIYRLLFFIIKLKFKKRRIL